MTQFESATTAQHTSGDHFSWFPDLSWGQGPGVYGGLTLAAMARTTENLADFPIRRISAELYAPVNATPCIVKVFEKRRGSKTQFFQVDVTQASQPVAFASIACGAARPKDFDRNPTKVLPTFTGPQMPKHPMMPAFTNHFDYRVCDGSFPMRNEKAPRLYSAGWLSLSEPGVRDAAMVIGLLDAWWPALLLAANGPRPMATVSFTADLLAPASTSSGPCFLEVETDHVVDGYAVETDRLWSADGQLLGIAQQRIALIK